MREIAQRTMTAIAVPLAACLLLAFILGLQWWRDLQQVRRVEQLIEVAVGISGVISELQDERSLSASVLSGLPASKVSITSYRSIIM